MKMKPSNKQPAPAAPVFETVLPLPKPDGVISVIAEQAVMIQRMAMDLYTAIEHFGIGVQHHPLCDGVLEKQALDDAAKVLHKVEKIVTNFTGENGQPRTGRGWIEPEKPEPAKVASPSPDEFSSRLGDSAWDELKEVFRDDPLIYPNLLKIEAFAGPTPPRLWFASAVFDLARSRHDSDAIQQNLIEMLAQGAGLECKLSY